MLVVLDGGKALRAAVDAVFGHVPLQRCVRHKERNVLDRLPERDRPAVKRRLRAAWKLSDHRAAIERLEAFAGELAHSHPGAAASLREGLAETVTLQRLGVHPQQRLWRALHAELAGLSTDRVHVLALRSNHFVMDAQPEMVADGVTAVVRAVRDKTQLPPCERLFTDPDVRCLG